MFMHTLRATIVGLICGACVAAADAQTHWTVRGGTTELFFHADALQRLGLSAQEPGTQLSAAPTLHFTLPISATSDLVLTTRRGAGAHVASGRIVHLDGLTITSGPTREIWNTLMIQPSAAEPDEPLVARDASATQGGLLLGQLRIAIDAPSHQLLIEGADVAISAELAAALQRPELAGEPIASIQIVARLAWAGGDDPAAISAPAAPEAQGGTACLRPGGADVIVGDLFNVRNYASSNGIEAFAIGTSSCNVGTENLEWYAFTNRHPVIGQGMYRLKDGRFEQVGQSWLKHGFNALEENICGCGCNGDGGTVLGVGCSDPYDAILNGDQNRLGPRFQVNPSTGEFSYPYFAQGQTGTSVYKRLQVAIADLDPALAGGGQYFVEGQYVTPDDAAAGNQANNASFRPVTISGAGSAWSVALAGVTAREQPAIRAWETWDPTVETVEIMVPGDGLVLVAGKATFLGGSQWHYEYAVQNLYSDRAIGAFTVPVGIGAAVGGIGFHDVDYHSGEPYDGTDWTGEFDGQDLTWSTTPHATDPDANALRWGTIYNFRFDADLPPGPVELTLGIFKPGSPTSVTAVIVGPTGGVRCATAVGDGDGDCDVDLADYAALQWCFTGMGSPYARNCACFDADQDVDVDLADLALMAGVWAGPGVGVAGCAPP